MTKVKPKNLKALGPILLALTLSTASIKSYSSEDTDQSIISFGADLFQGGFKSASSLGLNPEYLFKTGDELTLTLFGNISETYSLSVDSRGFIVIPHIGPVMAGGISYQELSGLISSALKKRYNSTVQSYLSLSKASPLEVLVVGEVKQPGSYSGMNTDSLIKFLDSANGLTSNGSFRDIKVIRNGQEIISFDLYPFKKDGVLPFFLFKQGDVISVRKSKLVVNVSGLSNFSGNVELKAGTLGDLTKFISVSPKATHVQVERSQGLNNSVHLVNLKSVDFELMNSDKLLFVSEAVVSEFSVELKDAFGSTKQLISKKGSSLGQLLKSQEIPVEQWSRLRLYRQSVAKKQAEAIKSNLRVLEEATFTARSSTSEESAVKTAEANLVKSFIDKASTVKPSGRVILDSYSLNKLELEPGDVIELVSNQPLISVSGSVISPSSFQAMTSMKLETVLAKTGGTLQSNSDFKFIKIKSNGQATAIDLDDLVMPGEEVLVIPEVKTKNVELARAISTVLYQIAFSAKVVLGL